MQMFEYMNPNFRIEDNPSFNSVNGLNDISSYLDFGIKSTIHKQMPNVTPEIEKYYAKTILKNYMNGGDKAFTSQYGIRGNIQKISREKVKNMLIKILIEKGEYNRRVLHKLGPQNQDDEYADYVTNLVYAGQLEENNEWLKLNIPNFIDIYVEESYGKSLEEKARMEELCYDNPLTVRALEQLNLEMSLNRLKN